MMLRLILLPVLYFLLLWAVSRLVRGIIDGARGRRADGVAERSVPMVRDPVCGTFIVPSRAVVVSEGRTQLFFCSTRCRDKYRAHSA
jgi:YHS domain-containing protein